MIEYNQLKPLVEHLKTIGLRNVKPKKQGWDEYWVPVECQYDTQNAPIAFIVCEAECWKFRVLLRLCHQHFELETLEAVQKINQHVLSQFEERALEAEFLIAEQRATTKTTVLLWLDTQATPVD